MLQADRWPPGQFLGLRGERLEPRVKGYGRYEKMDGPLLNYFFQTNWTFSRMLRL